jgi:hypothetical protein
MLRAIGGQRLPKYLSLDHDPLYGFFAMYTWGSSRDFNTAADPIFGE